MQAVCRVGLQFEVDDAGMQAKFRKKLRSLAVTVPVIRDLRPQMAPVQPGAWPSMAVSLEDDAYDASSGREQEEASATAPAGARGGARQVPSMAMGLEDDDYGGGLHAHDAATGADVHSAVAEAQLLRARGDGSDGRGGDGRRSAQGVRGRAGAGEGAGGASASAEQGEAVALLEQARVMALELKEQGNKLVKEAKHAQALILYEQAIALWDKDPAAYTNRALCHTKAGNFEAAIADCRACLKLDGTFVRAHERLGAVYEAQKDFSAALAEYQAGLAIDPSHKGCASSAKSVADRINRINPPGSGGAVEAAPPKASAFAFANKPAASAATVKTAPSAATAASPSLSTAPSTRDMSANHKCIRDALSAYEVEVRSAAGRGRCVFAKGALGRGEVVLEARPMGCAVNDKYSELVCHYCFGLLPTIKAMQVKCSGGCGGVVYCKKQCAEADKLHQIGECQVLRTWNQQPSGQSKSTRGLRVFMRAVYMYAGDKGMAQLSELLEAEEGAEGDANMLSMAQVVNRFVMEEARMPVAKLARLISQAKRNVHAIVDVEGHNLGHGLYPVASFFNHSCWPNAVVSFQGQTLVVRALRDIQPAEEVTIAYAELYCPRNLRRQQLQAKKYFLCECTRCQLPSSDAREARIVAGPPELASEARNAFDRGLVEFQEDRFRESYGTLTAVLRQVGDSLGSEHWVVYDIHKLLVEVCFALKDWRGAEAYARLTVKAMEEHLPKYHPSIAHMCQQLAGALALQRAQPGTAGPPSPARLKEELRLHTKAWSVLCVSYGKEHKETLQAKQQADETRRVLSAQPSS